MFPLHDNHFLKARLAVVDEVQPSLPAVVVSDDFA